MEGGSARGIGYARTTFDQICRQYPEERPCLEITDAPAHHLRSFHIDCARHFFSIEELKKMACTASFFKLNMFHWHISDDQGWRIESRAFPRLHEIGAWRNGDHFGNYDSDEREGGYYTREEVRDLVAFCENLGIQVVPEIDMPGHVTAILAAYPNLSCQKNQVQVGMKSGIYRDIFCAGQEETSKFIETLLDDLLELFPGDYVHIGGDETPKVRWKTCPACQKKMEEEGLTSLQQLQGYMENRIISCLKKRGKTAIVWNEAAAGGNLDQDAIVQLWTEDKEGMTQAHVAKGGKVLLSTMMNCYCDYPYGFINTNRVYSLDTKPKELMDAAAQCLRQETKTSERAENTNAIIGTECLIWTEYVRTPKRLEELSWIRFCASAEVGWCGENRPGYEDFASRLKGLFPVFEEYGIHAEEPEGWVPSQEETMRQLMAFKQNLRQSDLDEMKEAQNEI